MAVFLIEGTEILDVDEKNLKRLGIVNPTVYFREEAAAVVQLRQGVDTFPLTLEGQEQHRFHKGHDKTVEHDFGIHPLNHNAQGDDGE